MQINPGKVVLKRGDFAIISKNSKVYLDQPDTKMIRFFRKIRQQLLTDNKISKYLIYAIGEIVLVVIGILIALQINNWNQNQNQHQTLVDLLIEIREDFRTDIKHLEENISLYEDRITINRWGLSKTTYESSPKDSLANYLVTIYSDRKLSDFGFSKLQAAGITNYFEYNSLIDTIKEFYLVKGRKFNIMVEWDTKYTTRDILWLKDQENSWEMTFVSSANSVASTSQEFPSLKSEKENINEIINDLTSTKFRNDKWDDLRRKEIMLDIFLKTKQKAIEIIESINKHLEEKRTKANMLR